MSKEDQKVKKLKKDIDVLLEIIRKQAVLINSLHSRAVKCEAQVITLERKKIEELLSTYDQRGRRDVF